ncbi:hypothetical protein [Xylella fastidiosa]|uniref:hypothetical protein n=1 Tax=Xylella fastidiosa TaxID=2371 RepID=UPI0009835A1E|nr:hypothetical protein [Xylella fastidiosa]AWG45319.1 hypothetical protein XFFB_08250 [Xylella fastidiosa]WGZ33723.1 hypothetical protein O4445_08625 [Xylella fastidiosa subsp. pauca]WGZ36046.1 hypothetical protein O4443_08600 [Xylella fastidiosa subsp. pauca]
MDIPKITIISDVIMRTVMTKEGFNIPIYSQLAVFETDLMKIQIYIDVGGLSAGYSVGTVKYWDFVVDLVPDKYGVGLSRKKTLVEIPVSGSSRSSSFVNVIFSKVS